MNDYTLDCLESFLAGMRHASIWSVDQVQAVETAIRSVREVLVVALEAKAADLSPNGTLDLDREELAGVSFALPSGGKVRLSKSDLLRVARDLEGEAVRPRPSPSNSPSELRRKHFQGTCDLKFCPYVSRVGVHLGVNVCLNCTMRPRLSKEANFCEECQKVTVLEDAVLRLEREREGWQEERDRAIAEKGTMETARDNALGTISIVRNVVNEAREKAWTTHEHGHLVSLMDVTLENLAEVVGIRLQSRPKPPPANVVEAVADLDAAVQADRGKPLHEILFPHVAYRDDARPVGDVLLVRGCKFCHLEERSLGGKVARVVRVEGPGTCSDGGHEWGKWKPGQSLRAFMAETETVRNRVRACALCGRRESYGADGKLYVEHGKAQCPEHAFTEWADTVSAGRASPEEEAKAEGTQE